MSTKSRRTNTPSSGAKAAPRPPWLVPAILAGLGVVLSAVAFFLIRAAQQEPYTPEVTGRPSAVIDQKYFDYGDVHFDSPVETTFKVKNVGDEPLIFLGEPQVELVEGC
jgi:hypothetical protein